MKQLLWDGFSNYNYKVIIKVVVGIFFVYKKKKKKFSQLFLNESQTLKYKLDCYIITNFVLF